MALNTGLELSTEVAISRGESKTMPLSVTSYADSDAVEWDRLVEGSTSGTFLHTRRFLALAAFEQVFNHYSTRGLKTILY